MGTHPRRDRSSVISISSPSAPSCAEIVTPDRQWLYSVAPERKAALAITFVEAGTGRKIACNAPEVATVLRRVAAEHGLVVQAAAITVTSSAGHDLEAR